MKSPILGGSYVARSVNAADNRMVNLFPEVVAEGGKEPAFLVRAPGLKEVNGVGAGPITGMYSMTEADGTAWLFVVSNLTLYYTTNIGSGFTSAGGLTGSAQIPCNFSDNGTQVFIVVPAGSSYVFDTSTSTLTSVTATDPDFPGASVVTYMDGFFVVNKPDTELVYVSALRDGLSWDPLAFASAERSPDGVIAVISNNQELWVMGRSSTEVWYDAGTSPFPLAPIQGAFNETGCLAALSVTKVDGSIYWLGRNNYGQAIVYRSNGYRAERISTYALEYEIQQRIATGGGFDAAAAFSYAYQQDGHVFYVLNIPLGSPNGYLTWVYDVSTGAWHERAGWSGSAFVSTRAFCYAFQFNRHYVGDYSTDQMYYFDPTWYKEGSTEQRWLRSWRALPTGANNLKETVHHSLQIDMETGTNASSMGTDEADISMRFSDDGGHTWSNTRTTSMGAASDYSKRVIFRRLGSTKKLRDRVYEISGTDPVKIAIMGAELIMSPTSA